MARRRVAQTRERVAHIHTWRMRIVYEQGQCLCDEDVHTCYAPFVQATCSCGAVLDMDEIEDILNVKNKTTVSN